MSETKPNLLYFRGPHDHLSPILIEPLIHKIERGLRAHFNVTHIGVDCDYAEVVERHQPDMVLFDGTIETDINRRLKISNVHAHQHIPRAGLMRVDALSPSRAVFAAEMASWGVETFFTNVDTAMGESFPEIADQLFYWPMFIDPEIFHDYGLDKVIPVLMIGYFENEILEYQWRAKVKKPLLDNFPCLYYRHPGYAKKPETQFSVSGESLARSLNASRFAPTCGAMKKIVVAKHLEIAGAKACLVTEDTQAVRAFGFRDMENCIFATADDIAQKISTVANDPQLYGRIIQSGYDLVHRHHTPHQRNQMVQWLKLKKQLKPGYKIIQPELFGDFRIVPTSSSERTIRISGATDLALIRAGIEAIEHRRLDDAEYFYKECLRFVPYMCEPQLGLGVIALLRGRAEEGATWIAKPIDFVLKFTGPTPDPLEWGYFIISHLCMGKLGKAVDWACAFPGLCRRELQFARWIAFFLANSDSLMKQLLHHMQQTSHLPETKSVHTFPRRTFQEMLGQVVAMLTACGQLSLAERLANCPAPEDSQNSYPMHHLAS